MTNGTVQGGGGGGGGAPGQKSGWLKEGVRRAAGVIRSNTLHNKNKILFSTVPPV